MMLKQLKLFLFVTLGICFISPMSFAADKIREGSAVKLNYSLMADDQPVVTKDKPQTMNLIIGTEAYPPAFEKQLIGMKLGDTKQITLSPDQAYGPRRPDLMKRVPKEQLPPDLKLTEGALIGAKGKKAMRVAKILDDSVILDQNNPLAGHTLKYSIQIIDVKS